MTDEHNNPEPEEPLDPEKRARMREIVQYLFGERDTLPEGVEMVDMGDDNGSRRVFLRPGDEDGTSVQKKIADLFTSLSGQNEEEVELRESNVSSSTVDTIFDDVKASLGTVNIKTDAFSTTAYGFYELPGMRVMGALATDEMRKMPEMVSLLKSAIIEPGKADYLDILNFGELGEVLSQWIEISQPEYEQQILRKFRKGK